MEETLAVSSSLIAMIGGLLYWIRLCSFEDRWGSVTGAFDLEEARRRRRY